MVDACLHSVRSKRSILGRRSVKIATFSAIAFGIEDQTLI